MYAEQKKMKAKMNYAAKLGIPFTVFLGEDEIAAGTATVKNMNMANDFSEEELQRLAAEGCHKQITLPADEAVSKCFLI